MQTSTVENTRFNQPIAGAAVVSLLPTSITSTGNPSFRVPLYADYNLSVQQELSASTVLAVAYVDSYGRHLIGEEDLNQPTLAARFASPNAYVDAIRPYQGYSFFKAGIPAFSSSLGIVAGDPAGTW